MNRKVIIAIGTTIVAAFIAYFVYKTIVFRFVGTDPGTDNVATVTPFFKVKFNKNLDSKSLKITSPQNIIGTYLVQGKLINITFKDTLQINQNYVIDVHGIRSSSGKTLADKSFVFQASYIPENQLPTEQRAEILHRQQQYSNDLNNNGLIKVLPFVSGGREFKVDYSVDSSGSNTRITIYIQSATPAGQQAGLEWIKSLGYSPFDYTIRYIAGQP